MLNKTARASRLGENALGMFQKAHDQLGQAVALAIEAEAEHAARVAHHSQKASEARALAASHLQAQTKLSEFLPN